MASGTFSCATNADDASELDDGTTFTATQNIINLQSHSSSASRNNAGLRFPSVTIPRGSAITAATCSLFVHSAKSDDANFDIYAEAVDNAVDFTSNADVTSRTNTTASVAWVANNLGTNLYVASPSITTVIQEIISRPGWVSGNAIVLLLRGKTSPDGTLIQFDGVDNSTPTHNEKIDVTWTVGKAPVFRQGWDRRHALMRNK